MKVKTRLTEEIILRYEPEVIKDEIDVEYRFSDTFSVFRKVGCETFYIMTMNLQGEQNCTIQIFSLSRLKKIYKIIEDKEFS